MFPGIVHRRTRTESLRSSDTAEAPGKGAKKGAGRSGDDDEDDDEGDDEGGDAEESEGIKNFFRY